MEDRGLVIAVASFGLVLWMSGGSMAADVVSVEGDDVVGAGPMEVPTDITLGSCTVERANDECYFQCDPFSPFGVEEVMGTGSATTTCSLDNLNAGNDKNIVVPVDLGLFGHCAGEGGKATCKGVFQMPIV